MTEHIDRRTFVVHGGAAALGMTAVGSTLRYRAGVGPSDRVVVAVMGVNSRGDEDAKT
jgi:hypothetical protein